MKATIKVNPTLLIEVEAETQKELFRGSPLGQVSKPLRIPVSAAVWNSAGAAAGASAVTRGTCTKAIEPSLPSESPSCSTTNR